MMTSSSPSAGGRPQRSRHALALALFVLCAAIATVAVMKAVDKNARSAIHKAYKPGEVTGSLSAAEQTGPSGLPLPRFVSLKSDTVNVRKGPSSDHDVAWVFHRKGMPVEITAEFDNWRRIRDSEGEEGWILQQMLTGRRTAIVMGYGGTSSIQLLEEPDASSGLVATLQKGVTADVKECDGQWCRINAGGYQGYARQEKIWGVYPGEIVD